MAKNHPKWGGFQDELFDFFRKTVNLDRKVRDFSVKNLHFDPKVREFSSFGAKKTYRPSQKLKKPNFVMPISIDLEQIERVLL